MNAGIQPTEADGEWVAEALDGLAPLDGIDPMWQFEGVQDREKHAINRYRQKGTNLVVMVSINPIQMKGDDEKKVSYHVTIAREKEGKIKKPNAADISRARKAFFLRELTTEERVHEGSVGDSRAHHIMAVVEHKIRLAKPGGGLF